MKGDFTRSSFQPRKHYSSVRMQQGRLQLDADWNEQIDIQNHLLQTHAKDLLGIAGVPNHDPNAISGFRLTRTSDGKDLAIAAGRIYIDGILCELEPGTLIPFERREAAIATQIEIATLQVDEQPFAKDQWLEIFTTTETTDLKSVGLVKIASVDLTPRQSKFTLVLQEEVPQSGFLRRIPTFFTQPDYPNPSVEDGEYIAYLDTWQRHITAIEDPQIREVALNLPDTTTRTKTIWQLKLVQKDAWKQLIQPRKAELKARVNRTTGTTNPGVQRLDNQLYRIEIHTPGIVGQATFKWSRDNGSIVSNIEDIGDNYITLAQVTRDLTPAFSPDQWVEITDEVQDLKGLPGVLVRLTAASSGSKLVFQKAKDSDVVSRDRFPKKQTPKVRRWDHKTSAEIPTASRWIPLENGIEIWFEPESSYQTGDYWLIPSRTAKNDIEWSRDSLGNPQPQPINGIQHRYCNLASVIVQNQTFTTVANENYDFVPLMDCLPKAGGTITGSLKIEKILEVNGLKIDTTQGDNLVHFQSNYQAYSFDNQIRVGTGVISSIGNSSLLFRTGNTNRVKILNDTGYVGIGVETPEAQLHLANSSTQAFKIGTIERYFAIDTPTLEQARFSTNAQEFYFDQKLTIASGKISTPAHQNLFLQTEGSNQVAILHGSGNVGIGTDIPDAKLHIVAPIDHPKALKISTSDRTIEISTQSDNQVHFETNCDRYIFNKEITIDSGRISSQNSFSLRAGNSNSITILSTNGNVGIGVEQPEVKLQVEGDVKINGHTLVSSSRQLKCKIAQLPTQDAIELLENLNPVTFQRHSDSTQQLCAGFIAEEVPDLFASKDRTAIKPMEIIAVLTQRVQDHEHTIAALTQQLKTQQTELSTLTQRIQILEHYPASSRRLPSVRKTMLRVLKFLLKNRRSSIR